MDSNRKGTSKFTCYFCNKTIENETEMGHTTVCGSVLVPCPNKCGAYVPRMDFNKHKRECINRITKSMPRLSPLNDEVGFRTNMPTTTSSLERQTNGHPQKPPTKINEEMFKLSRKVADLEKYLQNQARSQTQNSPQSYGDLRNNQVQQNMEIEKVKYQQKITIDWKKNIETQIYSLRQSISIFQNSKKDTDIHWITVQDRLMVLDKIQMELSYLKDTIFKEQNYNRQSTNNLLQDINGIKDLVNQEHISAASVFNDHQVALESLRRDSDDFKKAFEEQRNKFTNIVFDLRAASQIASEAAEKIEILERDFGEIKKEINQIKLDMEILEGLSSSEGTGSYGRLIWKVTEVEAKMQRAKDFDSVVKSPVFYTHEYGYKIRILMYLNGMKKWKDRYALLCIHVLKGEYDMLLKWPCHIEGTIILRDLENIDKPKPFSKYITAKRQQSDEENEEPQESSSTFIFIPHSTLLKGNFVKEDTLFIEVKIIQNAKLETSL
ncbi:TNF receptor-associated factor 5 isoform X1 [Anoplophora glabripennis]|nr:TNF receptor-associated factor 5 isoform X1 [Anoplophora glabripennis]